MEDSIKDRAFKNQVRDYELRDHFLIREVNTFIFNLLGEQEKTLLKIKNKEITIEQALGEIVVVKDSLTKIGEQLIIKKNESR